MKLKRICAGVYQSDCGRVRIERRMSMTTWPGWAWSVDGVWCPPHGRPPTLDAAKQAAQREIDRRDGKTGEKS